MKAMLLAAGFGTRLKPFTDKHPKALAVINGKTLLQRNIEYLQQFDIYDVIINVHHFADEIIQTIKKNNDWGSKISISDETDDILETGGGLKRAAWFFKDVGNFILMNVDVLTDLEINLMIDAHTKNNPLATLATTNRETSRYFLFDNKNILRGWRNIKTGEEKPKHFTDEEKFSLKQKAFSGIHVINKEIFNLIKQTEKKFSMVDVYLSLCEEQEISSFDHSNTKFVDVGKPESIRLAEKMFL